MMFFTKTTLVARGDAAHYSVVLTFVYGQQHSDSVEVWLTSTVQEFLFTLLSVARLSVL